MNEAESEKWLEARKSLEAIMEMAEFYYERDTYSNVLEDITAEKEKILDYLYHVKRKLKGVANGKG